MDLKAYFKKIREAEALLTEPYLVMVSLQTPDGGAAGVRTEVSKPVAAQMIANGAARLATSEEAEEYRAQHEEARQESAAREAAQRMQVTVVAGDARFPKRG